MTTVSSLADALIREHHEIDAGIEQFLASTPDGSVTQWAQPLRTAMAALARHIYLEEEIVFPRLRSGPLMMPIMVMVTEHGRMWRAMADLHELLAAEDADAEPVRSRVLDACTAMLALLADHNGKEEPVIYPHLQADLDDDTRAVLADFIDTGTLPDGWSCERA